MDVANLEISMLLLYRVIIVAIILSVSRTTSITYVSKDIQRTFDNSLSNNLFKQVISIQIFDPVTWSASVISLYRYMILNDTRI